MRGGLSRWTRILIRWVWPIVLAYRLVIYAFTDDPPHIAFGHATRLEHATLYLIGAALVLLTMGRTKVKWLLVKVSVITAVAAFSIVGDFVVSETTSSRWNSSAGWLVVMTANIISVMLRLSWSEDGKA
jgi:hypothetical protein